MAEVEIGIGKSGRRAYGFDDIAIVPSRRTRDPEDVDISWEIDAYRFELPLMAAAMDGVTSPAIAVQVGQLGGTGVLNLEGLWTRYEDPEPLFEEISRLDDDKATARMQQIYTEPIKPELVTERIREIKERRGRLLRGRDPAADAEPRPGHPGGRARPARDPGDGRVGGARLEDHRAAQPQALHPRVRDPGDRRRLRVLPGGPAPDAHRRRGDPGGGGAGQRLHQSAACWAWASLRPRPSPTVPGPASATSTRPACTATSSPTAA